MKILKKVLILILIYYSGYSQNKADNKLTLSIFRVNEQGEEIENSSIDIKEQRLISQQPFLSFIFFDDNSSVIPDKYLQINKEQTKEFDIENLNNMTSLGIHHNALNIIGKRMTKTVKAVLTINGYNSEFGEEKNNKKLSEERAIRVKNYLVDVWKIEPNRIKTYGKKLPENPATYRKDELDIYRAEENSRVEFSTNNYDKEILGPIFCNDTLRFFEPYFLRLKMNFSDTIGIQSWKIYAGKRIFSGDNKFSYGQPIDLPENIDWNLASNQLILPLDNQRVYAQLTDLKNRNYLSPEYQIKVKISNINDFSYVTKKSYKEYTYQLNFFDYANNEIPKKLKDIYKDLFKKISEPIDDKASITVYGYTDLKLGSEDVNLKLSEDRAKRTIKALKLDKNKNVITKPMGGKELFSNDSPEGRFLSRTVILIIQAPITN